MATDSRLMLLTWAVFSVLVSVSALPRCPAVSECRCITGGEFELQCPMYRTPEITIRFHGSEKDIPDLDIECSTSNDTIYTGLPKLENVGMVKRVKFDSCPMPAGGTPIIRILEQFGVQRMMSLTLIARPEDDFYIVRQHLAGLKNLTNLTIRGFAPLENHEDFLDEVSNITSLDFRRNINFRPRMFEKLTELRFLELGEGIAHFDDGMFSNQKKLHTLNLWANRLQNLSKETFRGIASDVELDLSNNQLTSLQPDVFHHLANMFVVNLNANNFTDLPDGLFARNKKLKEVSLMVNRVELTKLPQRFFADLPLLEKVSIRCDLGELPENIFDGSTRISTLILSNNKLQQLPPKLLATQVNLTELHLSENQIDSLDDQFFAKNANLAVLKLSNNKLRTISRSLVNGLKSLEELYLDGNLLEHIDFYAFQQTALQVLHLQRNQLSLGYDDDPFQQLSLLEELDLSHNKLPVLPQSLYFVCTNLVKLDMSHNNLTMLDMNIVNFQWHQRTTIDLSHNQIRTIIVHPEIKTSPDYESDWILGDNPLDCNCSLINLSRMLHGKFGNARHSKINYVMEELRCAQPPNLAGKTIASVSPQELLCPLDSARTQIKYCPAGCSCWRRVNDETAILNCSNAGLTAFPNITKLENTSFNQTMVNLENNRIAQLPRASLNGYKRVTHLFLKNNQIDSLSADSLPPNLRELDVSGNQLTKLGSDVMAKLNASHIIKALRIGGNPWVCDCAADELKSFLQLNERFIKDRNASLCEDNSHLMDRNDLCPFDKTITIAIGVVVALLGLLIGAIAALYFKYQQEVKVWLFAHNLCLWFVTEEELDKDKKYDAFISYSHHDEDFITEQLVPELERGPHPFKICLHFRDWVAGEFIPNQISRSVEDSRRTIIVLSPNFLESVWGRMEFRAAHKNALTEGRTRVLVIIYGDIGDIEKLDPEMKCYLKTNTYIQWGDPWFFDKLRYALPHPTNYRTRGLIKSTMKSSIDDKLELIKPVAVTPPLTTPPTEQANTNPLVAKLNAQNNKYISNGLNGLNGLNGHVNNAFIINPNAKQSDV